MSATRADEEEREELIARELWIAKNWEAFKNSKRRDVRRRR